MRRPAGLQLAAVGNHNLCRWLPQPGTIALDLLNYVHSLHDRAKDHVLTNVPFSPVVRSIRTGAHLPATNVRPCHPENQNAKKPCRKAALDLGCHSLARAGPGEIGQGPAPRLPPTGADTEVESAAENAAGQGESPRRHGEHGAAETWMTSDKSHCRRCLLAAGHSTRIAAWGNRR